jgi:hypothetical protein
MTTNTKKTIWDNARVLAPQMITIMSGVMIALTLLGAFWAALFPIRGSNDPWWHLKTGQYLWNYFAEHGILHFPPYDVFTYTGETTPWINHEWLSHIIFYAMYLLGGIHGVIVFKAFVFTLTIALLMLYMIRNGVSWKMACLGSMLALLACQSTLFFTTSYIHVFIYRNFFTHYIIVPIRRKILVCLYRGHCC